jgi:chemotaxis protein MotA
MGFAMITTVYGIVAANLLLKPLAIKMERQVQQKLVQLKMLEEGVLMFNERRHPLMIKETLDHFLLHHQGPTPASTRNSALKAA